MRVKCCILGVIVFDFGLFFGLFEVILVFFEILQATNSMQRYEEKTT